MKTATLNSDEMLKTMLAEAVKQQTQIRSAVCAITQGVAVARAWSWPDQQRGQQRDQRPGIKQGTEEAGARLTQQWASVLDKFRTAEPTPASA